MRTTPTISHLEEKIHILMEAQKKGEDSAAKYKQCYEKLKEKKKEC